MRSRSSIAMFLTAGLVLCVTGCGGPSLPKTIAVSGKVTYKSKPLDGAAVGFIATKGPSASAVTDANGAYKLTTYKNGDGAVPGEYAVTITKVIDPNPGASYLDPNSAKLKSLIPEKYGEIKTSGFTAKVEKGKQEFIFNLD
jgi:hypothetical protein